MSVLKKTRKTKVTETIRNQRKSVNDRIVQLMGARSQNSWSKELGVPQQSISRYVTGHSAPHIDFLILLGRKENVNMNWLVLGEGRVKR